MIEQIDSAFVYAANTDNFQSLVIDNSKSGPVLVNFWSKNAAPSMRQYPILDKLVHAYKGRFLLVNVDTLREVKISNGCAITSVPTLKLFRNEKIVASRHGYQSETDLSHMLDSYVARDSDPMLSQALAQYVRGNRANAYATIAKAIVADPGNARLPFALCKLLMHDRRYGDADALLQSLPEDIQSNTELTRIQDKLSIVRVAEEIHDPQALLEHIQTVPTDLDAKAKLTAYYVQQKNYELAMLELVKIMDRDIQYNRQLARKWMLKLFNILGDEHPLIRRFRPELLRYTY